MEVQQMGNTEKKAPGKKKIAIFVVIGIVVVALAVGGYFLNTLVTYRKNVAAIQIKNADLTAIRDGEYFGESDVGLVSAKVRVVVENHKISVIELIEHNNGRGVPAEVIPDRIIEEQRIDVDAVSGATASSNVIRAAVYNALAG